MDTVGDSTPDVVPGRQELPHVPPWQRNRPLKTVAIYLAFVVAGVTYSMLGPSVPSLEILLDCKLHQVSAGFVCNSSGYLLGAILCGFVYSYVNKELLFLSSLVLAGSMTVMIPHSWSLGMYLAAMAVQGFSTGFIDTGSQSYILKLWEDHRLMPAVMQGLHSMWSVGSITGPFILHPFLADIHQEDVDNFTSSQNFSNASYLQDLDVKEEVASLRFGFIIASVLVYVTALVFLAAFFKGEPSLLEPHRKRLRKSKQTPHDPNEVETESGKRFRIKLLCIGALYFFFFSWVEHLPANFISAFVVKGLDWKNDQGALISSTYWGTHGAGRALGIAIAICLKPKQMVIADLTITLIGFFLMFFASFHFSIIWIATAIAGLGIATLFPSALLFIEEYIEVTGSTSSVVTASASGGGMTGPILTGFLMERFGYLALAYVCISSIIVEAVIFSGIVLYSHRFGVKRHKKSLGEIKVESKDSVEMKPLNR